MTQLVNSNCEACRADAPRVSEQELPLLLSEIPAWVPIVIDNVMRLERSYSFPDFVSAIAFTNQVGELAEAENHHPALVTEWGKVTVTWWTHKIKGLHRNDFIMAAKTDRAYLGYL